MAADGIFIYMYCFFNTLTKQEPYYWSDSQIPFYSDYRFNPQKVSQYFSGNQITNENEVK